MYHHLCVERINAGLELDEFLAVSFPRVPKRFLRGLVRAGEVLVDGVEAPLGQRLLEHQVVSLELDEDQLPERGPEAVVVPIDVLYEDAHVIAVNKPADLVVEPDRWDSSRPSLIDSLERWASERSTQSFRPRLLHRLDRGTSGVVLVARTIDAERALRQAFDERRVTKRYLALVEGELALEEGQELRIDYRLGPDPRKSGRMVAVPEGDAELESSGDRKLAKRARRKQTETKPALTTVRTRQRFRGYTLLECEPLTGRTHQIRVHLAEAGFPLAVDPLYGRRDALLLSELKAGYRPKPGRPESPLISRLTLHAEAITFPHVAPSGCGPDSGQQEHPAITVEAPHARDFDRVLKQLSKVRAPRR